MSRRKPRIEAWAIVLGESEVYSLSARPLVVDPIRFDPAHNARVVRLVPYSPAEARLVRAVGAWDKGGNPDWGPLLRRVRDAYQAVKRERRNK